MMRQKQMSLIIQCVTEMVKTGKMFQEVRKSVHVQYYVIACALSYHHIDKYSF